MQRALRASSLVPPGFAVMGTESEGGHVRAQPEVVSPSIEPETAVRDLQRLVAHLAGDRVATRAPDFTATTARK